MAVNLLAGSVWEIVFSVVIALLVLLLTITVHEFGHYIVAKLFKFDIIEFSIGIGPAIFKKKRKDGELFSVRMFPLGGYCAFRSVEEIEAENKAKVPAEVDNQQNSESTTALNKPLATDNVISLEKKEADKITDLEIKEKYPNAFENKKPWQRILVLIAGAAMNYITALLIIILTFVIYGHSIIGVEEVMPPSGEFATENTLLSGDSIVKIDGRFMYATSDLIHALKGKKKGDLVEVEVLRGGEKKTILVELREDATSENLSDIIPSLSALGFGTVISFSIKEGTALNSLDGLFVYAVADGADFSSSTRIYSGSELCEQLNEKKGGDSIAFWVSDTIGGEKRKEEVVLPVGFDPTSIVADDPSLPNAKTKNTKMIEELGFDGITLTYLTKAGSIKFGFFECIGRSVEYSFTIVSTTFEALGQIFTGNLSVKTLSGPVSTITMTSRFVRQGFSFVLQIAALIGVSLAIMNLLPIPSLDGARCVFVIIEWIRGKPVNRRIEATIHFVGIIVLFAFAIFIDVFKLF